jgi:tetratricopeptide (TPR) repeat protein
MFNTKIITTLLIICSTACPLMAQADQWRAAMDQASSFQQLQKPDAALEEYDRALKVVKSDPELTSALAITLGRRSALLHDLERTGEAEKGYLQALSLLQKHPDAQRLRAHIAGLKLSLASLYLEADQPSKAVKLRVEELLDYELSTTNKGRVYGILAGIAFADHRYADAEAAWHKEIATTESERQGVDTATALSNLGVLSAAKRDYRSAAERLTRALQLFQSASGLNHPKTVRAQSNLGQVLLLLGRRSEAVEWLGNAYELAVKWFGPENVITVQMGLDYSQALRKTGRKDEAKALEAGLKQLPGETVAALRARSTVDVMRLK